LEFSPSLTNLKNICIDDKCGGIISANKGTLKYKVGTNYFSNERCIWLLESPKSTSISFKLMQEGFEPCCDYIYITSVDPNSGKLRNDTTQIKYEIMIISQLIILANFSFEF